MNPLKKTEPFALDVNIPINVTGFDIQIRESEYKSTLSRRIFTIRSILTWITLALVQNFITFF